MKKEVVQEILFRVLDELDGGCGAEASGCCEGTPIDIPVEVSAKHVHLTKEAVEQLFGPGATLTPKRPLSQPGQFLSEERVTLVTPKGQIEHVAVLGPARDYIQTELSATDCRTLGIKAPLRLSGDLKGAADVYIVGPKGMIFAKESAIVAQAHIHLTPEAAEQMHITDGQVVPVTIPGERSITMEHVICRVSKTAGVAMHIDFDEANACMLPDHTTIRICGGTKPCCLPNQAEDACFEETACEDTCTEVISEKLVTEAVALQLIAGGKKKFELPKGSLITPSALDAMRHAGAEVIRQ